MDRMNRIKDLRLQSCIPILSILSIPVNFSFLNLSFRDDARPFRQRVSLLVGVRESEDC
jgi:hypothetical protein